MMTFIFFTIFFIITIFLSLLIVSANKRNQKIRAGVSEAGYETALDILFPDESGKVRRSSGYGPILPF